MLTVKEAARIATLRTLDLFHAGPRRALDAIALLAARACDAPAGAVSLVDSDRLHLTTSGVSRMTELPRVGSPCDVVTASEKLTIVEDLVADERFTDHPIVQAYGARAYAGAPIVLANGICLGTVCAIDTVVRPFTQAQTNALQSVRDRAVALLDSLNGAQSAPEQYLEILNSAASFVNSGIGVYVVASGQDAPTVEYINAAMVSRGGIGSEEYKRDPAAFFGIAENQRLLDECIVRARLADASMFDAELTSAHGHRYWVECRVEILRPLTPGDLRFMLVTRDISERKRGESFQTLLVAAIETEPDGVLIVEMNPETPLQPKVVYANDAFYSLCGYSRHELADGTYPRIFGAGTDRNVVREAAARVFAGEAVRREVLLYRKDGAQFWAQVRAHPLESPAKHCVLIIRDFTERRNARERARLLSAALEQAGDFIVVTDTVPPSRGGPAIIYANASFAQANGYGKDDVIGATWSKFFSPRNDPKVLETINAGLESGSSNFQEFLLRRADGEDVWVEFVDQPFHGMDDNADYRIAIGRDITLRRRAISQISLLHTAVEESRDATIIYERDGSGQLAPIYENEIAAAAGRYRLVELLRGRESGELYEELLTKRQARRIFADAAVSGMPHIVEFSARSLQTGDGITAVVTVERPLGRAVISNGGYSSRFLDLCTILPAIAEATSTQERFAILRALLLDTFDAEVESGGVSNATSVHVYPDALFASFAFGGFERIARWSKPLEETAITALRFAIEAAIEHDDARARETR
ncbi:MAG TPA: PAS domain S-box protein [Candidatus Baltobacteraceae bacterium]|nr:PAS domain S-box protein [Candidatus Baltobacteraceae bacterium]